MLTLLEPAQLMLWAMTRKSRINQDSDTTHVPCYPNCLHFVHVLLSNSVFRSTRKLIPTMACRDSPLTICHVLYIVPHCTATNHD